MSHLVWPVLVVFNLRFVMTVKSKIECGYKQCPQTRDGALNVHLVPHSHLDAGWVKTFDEYYYGTKTTVSTANVQLIYHSVLSELLHDKRRKFTFSETGYFWRWWKEQRPATRATFRTLVQEGRLEFAGGGWVHNDEATPDYLQIIDQYTWGLRKLNDTLGSCGKPKAAWQIDAYGHSREQASLLAQMGFDGLFIGRVDHKERESMIEEDRMEYMWRGSDILGKMSDIMTHALFNLYNAPEGFCFDFLCNDEPIIDDPDNKVYNADKRVNDFIAHIERQAKYYDHDNIMVTMGGDFTYQSAANWFMNMDKLINHVNTHPANMSDINIFYSTPSCYLKAIYLFGKRDKALYTDRGDHFPYGSDATTYWTGFYSSRPSLKFLARRAHVFLQVVKQLTVIARMTDSYELHLLRHAVSLVLHHDAITGTSQQHVTNDFIRILSEAISVCTKKVSNLLGYLTPTWGGSRRSKNTQQFIVCHQLNMTQCRFTETQESFLLLVYNPLSIKTYHYVKFPAIALHYSIRDFNDEEVEYQLVPLTTAVINLPGRSSTAIQELCFEAENIPPLGFSAYYITPVRDPLEENEYMKKVQSSTQLPDHELVPFISNEYIKVTADKATGLLDSVQHVDGIKVQVSQNFHYYSQTQQAQQSGAYSFRPEKNRPVAVSEKVTYSVIRGNLVKEIRQKFSDWITQIIRLYRGEEFVELEWVIGPVPIGTDLGKEVVSIFKTNITNNGEFYTDSNARQMMKRTCWNETANQQQKKPVAACYFPVTSRICIRSLNSSVEMCVLTDRAQGSTAYNEGEVELMVHRRLLTDDGFGLEETLNEEAYGVGLVVKGKHRIFFGNFRQDVDDQTFSERAATAARRWQYEPWLFMTTGDKLNRRKWQNVRNKRYSALRLHGLPRHIRILTLEPWKTGSVLLRLENTLEKPTKGRYSRDKDGSEDFSKPTHITVELRKVFLQMQIVMVRETTLAANQWLEDARQMDWSTRYVYTGGDDGLMPEDNIEDIEDKPKSLDNKDSGHYSDEDTEFQRRRPQRPKYNDKVRGKNKSPYEDYERKKRSLNSTENYIENVINDTTKDWISDNSTTEGPKEDTVFENETLATQHMDPIRTTAREMRTATRRTPKLSFLSRAKPSKLRLEWTADGEEVLSEEDFSSNLKKRSAKRKKKITKASKAEAVEDADDGVTRSIYEMYYMTKPRSPSRPTRSEEDEDRPRHKKKTRRFRNDYEQSTRKTYESRSKKRGKGMRLDMPFFITDSGKKYEKLIEDSTEERRPKENAEYRSKGIDRRIPSNTAFPKVKKIKEADYQDYESDEDDAEDYNDRKSEKKRRKRTIPKEEPVEANSETNEPEPDYVVTLRPTQIRTFVIWFESHKKNYVI